MYNLDKYIKSRVKARLKIQFRGNDLKKYKNKDSDGPNFLEKNVGATKKTME